MFNILLYNCHFDAKSRKNMNFWQFNQKHITKSSTKLIFWMLYYLHKSCKNSFYHRHFDGYESTTRISICDRFNLIAIHRQFIGVSYIGMFSHKRTVYYHHMLKYFVCFKKLYEFSQKHLGWKHRLTWYMYIS